jgi:hypothetical protein
MKLNPNVFRVAAARIDAGKNYCSFSAIFDSSSTYDEGRKHTSAFLDMFGVHRLSYTNRLCMFITLDFAALIADEGDFNPKEWRR